MKSLFARVGCTIAVREIQDTESKSASTKTRRRITISIDDTNDKRYGKLLSYFFKWWSKNENRTVRFRNILGITIKIGNEIIPLNLRTLSDMGFDCILVHGKNNYVMKIDDTTAKLSQHKKQIELKSDQWGCDKPYYRTHAISRAFGSLVILFFQDMGKIQTMMVFGKP